MSWERPQPQPHPRHGELRHCTALHPRPLNNTPCCTGEAVPLHAGAHPPRPPRALHLEAACHRGELHADDQHPTARASAPAASPARNLSSRPTRLVPSSPHHQRRLTLWQGFGAGDLNAFYHDDYSVIDPRTADDYLRRPSLLPAATAAAALASLHNHRPEFEWDSDPVSSRAAASLPQPSCMIWCADAAVVSRTQHQSQTRKSTGPGPVSLPPPWSSTSLPRSRTTHPRQSSVSCCPLRSHARRQAGPLRCRQLHAPDLERHQLDRMLAKASMRDRSPGIITVG